MEAVTVHLHKELSDEAIAALASARKTPRAEFISHDEVKKRLLG